jgi:hypothetical protein
MPDTAIPTEYVILAAADNDAGYWHQLGTQRARSSDAALRAYFNSPGSSTYKSVVAIPARSFQPVTLKVETQTVIKLQPATSQDA